MYSLEVDLRRFRKLAPAFAVAAIAVAAVAGPASANGGGHGGGYAPTPGVLDASGDGIAAAAGNLSLHICAEDGILLTKGNVTIAEDAFTDDVGWLGLHVYFGVHGCADVASGPSMMGYGGDGGRAAALAAGTGLTLHAEGTGIAFLKGTGTWDNGNGGTGAWGEDGAILKIGGKASCSMQAQHDGGHNKPACATATPAPEPTATP
jgi:hypothetical protein